jgi:hypothetical protein
VARFWKKNTAGLYRDSEGLAQCAHTIKSPLGTLDRTLALADDAEKVLSQLTSWTTATPEGTAS